MKINSLNGKDKSDAAIKSSELSMVLCINYEDNLNSIK